MLRRAAVCAVLAVVGTAAAPLASAEDLTIVSKTTSSMGSGGTTTSYYAANRFRVSDASGSDVIFDAAKGTVVFVDNGKKQYSESTLAEMEAALKAGSDMMSQAMKDLPPEAKNNPMMAEMMAKMGGGGTPLEAKVTKGANPKKVAGYDCEHWVIAIGPSTKTEIWTTSALSFPPQLYDIRKAFASLNPMMKSMAQMFDEMRKIKGFTLADQTSFSMMGRSVTSSSEATEVKKSAIPDSAFEVPAGYKKVDSPFVEMQKSMGKGGRK
jgi:hypothetical protein